MNWFIYFLQKTPRAQDLLKVKDNFSNGHKLHLLTQISPNKQNHLRSNRYWSSVQDSSTR